MISQSAVCNSRGWPYRNGNVDSIDIVDEWTSEARAKSIRLSSSAVVSCGKNQLLVRESRQ